MSASLDSESAEEQLDELEEHGPVVRALVAIRRSAILFTATAGLILIAVGASPLTSGLFSGMFGVWGGTLVFCAALGFVGVKALRWLGD